ncbi:MarR family transcriptional regulator [Neptunomonas phycophila]|uniref:MarR family winged helix-turn-helix transcriptional regulator n=1 Tax=Neptunomonas phycophila TaxID=1572645 RepID=UPI001BE803AF|nr:MarR family transcriptional regulator [Neptunomonas phycophila]MBT3145471.1 MarR family transcriptional regulator [Neptunomonas phycophila]MDO6785498.1 MarR family transcriptional regulator [Neptunomonas phycophila]
MSKHSPTSPPINESARNRSFGLQIGHLHRLWRASITSVVQPLDMTESRWTAMVHLSKLGEGCSPRALANELAIEMPSLTRTLNQLQEHGLIERRQHPSDKRSQCLWFTPKGRDRLTELNHYIHAVREAFYQGVTDEELEAVSDTLTRMENNAKRWLTHVDNEEDQP